MTDELDLQLQGYFLVDYQAEAAMIAHCPSIDLNRTVTDLLWMIL